VWSTEENTVACRLNNDHKLLITRESNGIKIKVFYEKPNGKLVIIYYNFISDPQLGAVYKKSR